MTKTSICKILIICAVVFQTFSVNSQTLLGNSQFYHTFSGTNFPYKIGSFLYTNPRQYDDFGKDISVSYQIDHKIVISHYIYPVNHRMLDTHFDEYKKSLLAGYAKSKLLSTNKIITKGIAGRFSKIECVTDFFDKKQMVYTYVYIYESLDWFTMLRVTCQIDDNITIENEIKEYISQMPFPTIKYK